MNEVYPSELDVFPPGGALISMSGKDQAAKSQSLMNESEEFVAKKPTKKKSRGRPVAALQLRQMRLRLVLPKVLGTVCNKFLKICSRHQ